MENENLNEKMAEKEEMKDEIDSSGDFNETLDDLELKSDMPVAENMDMEEPEEKKENGSVAEALGQLNERWLEQNDSYKKMAVDVREMHKLYHNEFAGRLKSMQDELEHYHEIDKGRVFDDILREIARLYCDNEALLDAEVDDKTAKHIKYFFMDIEQLLESNGVMLQKSKVGDKRNNKFCQVVERIETDNPELNDTVVSSKSTGFYTEKRPLIKELVDIYVYRETVAVDMAE